MIHGARFEKDDRTIIEYDLSKIVSIDGTTLGVNFPGKIAPTVSGPMIDLGFLRYDSLEIYRGDAQDTVDGWSILEANHVKITEAAYSLANSDIMTAYVGPEGLPRLLPVIPSIVSLGRLARYVKLLQKMRIKGSLAIPLMIRRRSNPCAAAYMNFIEGENR